MLFKQEAHLWIGCDKRSHFDCFAFLSDEELLRISNLLHLKYAVSLLSSFIFPRLRIELSDPFGLCITSRVGLLGVGLLAGMYLLLFLLVGHVLKHFCSLVKDRLNLLLVVIEDANEASLAPPAELVATRGPS